MRSRMTLLRIFGVISAAVFLAACTPEPNPGSSNTNKPAAAANQSSTGSAATGESLMRSMSDTLAKSNAFSFETKEQIEAIAPGGEKRTAQFTRKVTVRRPNGLYFELQSKGETPVEIAAIYDGKTVTLNEKPNGPMAQTAVPGTLDEMLDDVAKRFGLPIPIADVVYSSPYDAFIGPKSRGGLAARETIDGVECVRIEYSDDFVGVTLWLPASGPALPQRLELAYKQTSVPLVTQINFSNWKLDAPANDAMFTFQPSAGQATVDFAKFVAGVASRSMPASSKDTPAAGSQPKPADSPKAK